MDGEKVIKSLKSLLLSRKTGMFIQDLVKEYRDTENSKIPFQELGYNSFLDLLYASDSFNVTKTEKNEFFVTAKPSSHSKHVTDLVKGQHSNKNSKHKSPCMPLESIDENEAMKKPFRYLNTPRTNDFSANQNETINKQSFAVRDENNNNFQTGQASTNAAGYHDENKINIPDRLKQNHHDGVKRFKQRESKSRNGLHTAVGSSNQTLIDMLNGPFDPQRWTMNRRNPLANRNFNMMNRMPPKMSVRLEIPKFIETDELPECGKVMVDAQIDGWNFETDHTFISHSAMQQTYNYPMALMDGSVHNDLSLARMPSNVKHSEAQLKGNKAVTEIPSLNLPWYDDEWPITVTTVASTDDVWGYLRGHDYFPKLESTLKRHEMEILSGKKVSSIAKNIKPGGYYYIMIWKCYRLRVLHNNENDRKALCLLIDYAEDDWFNWDQMYEMDHDLASIPSQAVRFSLINLEEYASHKAFTNKAITCLIGKQLLAKVKTTEEDFAMQKLVNRMDPKVKILAVNQITGQNVNEVILGKDDEPMDSIEKRIMIVQSAPKSGLVDVNVPIPMDTEPIAEQMEIPVRNLPAKNQVTVAVTSASSPSDFHFRLISDDGIMSSLMKSLSTASFNHCPKSDEIKTANYYAAKFVDGKWYRLQVKELIANMADVYRCDVGDTHRLQTAKLCTLTSEFVQWPQLAIPAKLGGIIPVDGIWTDEANAYFRKLTLNVRLEAKFIKSHVSDQNGVTYPIEVALIEGPIRSRIGDIMIEQRLAKKA